MLAGQTKYGAIAISLAPWHVDRVLVVSQTERERDEVYALAMSQRPTGALCQLLVAPWGHRHFMATMK
jgi:hypothetical protein